MKCGCGADLTEEDGALCESCMEFIEANRTARSAFRSARALTQAVVTTEKPRLDILLQPGDDKREDRGLPSRKEMERRYQEANAMPKITEKEMQEWMDERCKGLGRCMVSPFGSPGCKAYPVCYKTAAKIRTLIKKAGRRNS